MFSTSWLSLRSLGCKNSSGRPVGLISTQVSSKSEGVGTSYIVYGTQYTVYSIYYILYSVYTSSLVVYVVAGGGLRPSPTPYIPIYNGDLIFVGF